MSDIPHTLEPVPFLTLVDRTDKAVRRHFRSIYLSVAIPVAVLQLPLPLFQSLWIDRIILQETPDLSLVAPIVGFGCLVLVLSLVAQLLYSVMSMAAVDAVAGRTVDMRSRWRMLVRGRFLWTLFLVMLSLLAGYLLCILPVIYVALVVAFVIPVVAEEGLFGGAAISRSRRLVIYNPGQKFSQHPMVKVFLVFFIGFVISGVVSLVVQVPVSIVEQVVILRQATGQQQMPGWLIALRAPAQLLGSFAVSAVQLYLSFAIALLYFDLRQRQEGRDLEQAVAELTGDGLGPDPEGAPS